MKTKNNSQKIVSAKILAKLVELAAKYVVPFVKINAPGKYTAGMELWKADDGLTTVYDVVPDVFDFEILGEDESDPSVKPIYWNNQWYGSMMIPEIKFNRIS